MTAAARLGLAATLVCLLASCGGATAERPEPGPAPSRVTSEETGDELGRALAELEGAERELGTLLGTPPAEEADVQPGAESPAPPAAPAHEPQRPEAEGLAAGPRDRCKLACRALGSMSRAAGRLCDLAGEREDRCVTARQRVSEARTRVTRACPACQGS
jgi:hypothetical protein